MLPLVKWSPTRELSSLHREMDELFNRVFGRTERLFPRAYGELGSTPALDYAIKGDKLVIRAELPGVEPDKVDISVTGNLLTIRGERKEEKEVKEEDYCIHEIGTGVFERTLTLPEGVDSDKIKASYKNGILQVTMPAAEIKKGKKVQVEVEEPKKLKAA